MSNSSATRTRRPIQSLAARAIATMIGRLGSASPFLSLSKCCREIPAHSASRETRTPFARMKDSRRVYVATAN